MQKTLIEKIPIAIPEEILPYVEGAKLYDSSCQSGAKVYYVEKGEGYFLKIAPKGTLIRECEMTRYFHQKGMGAEVVHFSSNESDVMLSKRVLGEDCVHSMHLSEPKRLSILLGKELRKLHELDCTDCPRTNKMEEYVARAKENYLTDNYDKSHFPDNFGYRSGGEAYSVLMEGKDALKCEVLLHGDYCLPNVMLKDWKLSGFIDVGEGGIGDRHVDLFWGLWSLGFNLKTERYNDLFLDAYGKDKVDKEILKIISAIEVFG